MPGTALEIVGRVACRVHISFWYIRQGLRVVACMLLIAMLGRTGIYDSIGFGYDQGSIPDHIALEC